MIVLAPQKFALLFTLGRRLGILSIYLVYLVYLVHMHILIILYPACPFVEALCASLAAFQLFEDIRLS